jgi:hypothetical protein
MPHREHVVLPLESIIRECCREIIVFVSKGTRKIQFRSGKNSEILVLNLATDLQYSDMCPALCECRHSKNGLRN